MFKMHTTVVALIKSIHGLLAVTDSDYIQLD